MLPGIPFIYLSLIQNERQCFTTCLALGSGWNESSSEERAAVLAEAEASRRRCRDGQSCEWSSHQQRMSTEVVELVKTLMTSCVRLARDLFISFQETWLIPYPCGYPAVKHSWNFRRGTKGSLLRTWPLFWFGVLVMVCSGCRGMAQITRSRLSWFYAYFWEQVSTQRDVLENFTLDLGCPPRKS